MQDCKALLVEEKDEEIIDIANQELAEIEEQIEGQADEIIDLLLPKTDVDGRNCTLEVMQAAGGSESSLFCEEIFNMYKAYCRLMGFKAEQVDFM